MVPWQLWLLMRSYGKRLGPGKNSVGRPSAGKLSTLGRNVLEKSSSHDARAARAAGWPPPTLACKHLK